jgi:methylenetetrahydrofolate reductase (NADPH)
MADMLDRPMVACAALLDGYSIEVTGRRETVVATCTAALPPGSEVYIAFPPSGSHERLARVACALSDAGFVAVPHIVARSLASFTRFAELLRALRDGGVDHALVIGGDRDTPAGPYRSAEHLLRTGAFERQGFRAIGLACYPEPHRRIDRSALDAALDAKLDLVSRGGMRPWLVSQFCLEAAPIVALAESLRARGIAAPLRVGIVGPTDRRSLWKYALACGIGASIRALGTHADAVRDLLQRETPDTLLADLAARFAGRPELGIAGVHIFGFGGVAATAAWARRACATAS